MFSFFIFFFANPFLSTFLINLETLSVLYYKYLCVYYIFNEYSALRLKNDILHIHWLIQFSTRKTLHFFLPRTSLWRAPCWANATSNTIQTSHSYYSFFFWKKKFFFERVSSYKLRRLILQLFNRYGLAVFIALITNRDIITPPPASVYAV